jgi:hypothetical protein
MKDSISLRSSAKFMLSALLLTLLAVIAAFGQETTGSIEGAVSDSTGARVPGATVKIEGAAFSRTSR